MDIQRRSLDIDRARTLENLLEIILSLLGGALFRVPFRDSSSRACLPTSRSKAAIRASYSWIRSEGLRIIVKGAFLILADPNADQLALDIVALCQSV
jgi:hypothetical protein